MQRREAMLARQAQRRPRMLTEWDYLLGVQDETRLGALRFRAPGGQFFLDSEHSLAAPPITSLRELQNVSLQFEQHLGVEGHPSHDRWLMQLLAPGSSLGGARPKASVRDETGALCLAKFPSHQDTRDVGAWELVAHRIAAAAGIKVPAARPLRMPESAHTTFLVRRFDRDSAGGRKAFVSAMTLTQRTDGQAGASYLELVDLLQTRGANTAADCEQLFRRVLLNVLIHNTDDHLRNHGFFIGGKGICLSPAYDINPSIGRTELSLAINEVEATCDVSIAMDACRDYGQSPPGPRKSCRRSRLPWQAGAKKQGGWVSHPQNKPLCQWRLKISAMSAIANELEVSIPTVNLCLAANKESERGEEN